VSCQYCGKKPATFYIIFPFFEKVVSNLRARVAACRDCHDKLHALKIEHVKVEVKK
jgi:protein-arginine kinase activator protein McsA